MSVCAAGKACETMQNAWGVGRGGGSRRGRRASTRCGVDGGWHVSYGVPHACSLRRWTWLVRAVVL